MPILSSSVLSGSVGDGNTTAAATAEERKWKNEAKKKSNTKTDVSENESLMKRLKQKQPQQEGSKGEK